MSYYFLGSALPDLQVGAPPDLGFHELLDLLKDNLSEVDYEKVKVIRRFYDIQNMRALWKGEELDKWGNLDQNELEEALLTRSGLASYVYDFLEQYDKTADRISHFPQLLAGYYNEELPKAKGFLFDYLNFERGWRLVSTAFRAKKLNRDIIKELQYENPDCNLVAQIVAQKDAPHYEPPDEYYDLKPIFEKHYQDPSELYQALCHYRFEKINGFSNIDRFSINGILSFVARFIIVDKWLELDKKKGMQIVDSIVKENS